MNFLGFDVLVSLTRMLWSDSDIWVHKQITLVLDLGKVLLSVVQGRRVPKNLIPSQPQQVCVKSEISREPRLLIG